MRKKLSIILLSFGGVLLAQTKSIEIIGNAPMLTNTPIALTRYNDYITKTEITLTSQTIGSDGKFSLTVPGASTGEYVLHVGNNSHSLLLEPGHIYNLEIPDPNGDDLYYPTETDTNLLLYQVSNLDYQINYFSIFNYEEITQGKVKPRLKKFLDTLEMRFGYIKDPYFLQYKEYKLAELMTNTNYKSRKTFYQTYLKGRPILYTHPQYMDFFNEFYTGYMNQLIRGNSTSLQNAVTNGTPIDTVLAVIKRSDFGDDEKLAELICIKGLFDLYYMPGYDKYRLESLVSELKNKTTSTEIKGIAEYFLQVIGRLKPGKQYPNFEGKDTEGNIHAITEYGGRHLFISFFAPDDAASIREIIALKNIYDEFRKDVTFVTVCSNCTYSSLQAFVTENKLKWTFLLVDPSVESDYEVISYPTAFFIDKEGKFVFSPSPLPSGGLSDKMYLYLKDQKRKNR
jgi:peroxiredoxin